MENQVFRIVHELKALGYDAKTYSDFGIHNWPIGRWRAEGLNPKEIAAEIARLIRLRENLLVCAHQLLEKDTSD